MVMPSIHDHRHGKLMKLQSVQGNNMVMREKNLCLCHDPGGSVLKQVNILFLICWKISLGIICQVEA